MATPEDFLKCALATVDKLALLFAGAPDDRAEATLSEFAERVRNGWREAFDFLRGEDVDGMVADLVDRIRKRRGEIEAAVGIDVSTLGAAHA